MKLPLEATPCPLCHAINSSPMLDGVEDYEYETVTNAFSYKRCRDCGLTYLDPRPKAEDLRLTYPREYEQYVGGISVLSAKRVAQRIRFRTSIVPRMRSVMLALDRRQPLRVLDVGCGNGLNLLAARRLAPGAELHGVDIGEAQGAYLVERGIIFHAGEFERVAVPEMYFNLVILSHVIEHFIDPLGVMRKVARVLAPGGIVYLETHVADCLERRLFGRYWIGFDAPRHLTVFDTKSLRRLMAECGLTTVLVDNRILSVGDPIYSLRRLLISRTRSRLIDVLVSDRNPALLTASLAFNLVRRLICGTSVARAIARRPAEARPGPFDEEPSPPTQAAS